MTIDRDTLERLAAGLNTDVAGVLKTAGIPNAGSKVENGGRLGAKEVSKLRRVLGEELEEAEAGVLPFAALTSNDGCRPIERDGKWRIQTPEGTFLPKSFPNRQAAEAELSRDDYTYGPYQ